jgi:phospholipid/cholesterol/gamma-HCH transport system ATP-binding protein
MADPIIRIEDLHKSFGEHEVLKGVDLDIEEGATVVILGASGSGKSVLMKHMIGLLRPDSGHVIVDGEDIVSMRETELQSVRKKFGMVFQQAALFDSMTVFENVAFPLREHHRRMPMAEVRERVRQKLEAVGLAGTEDKMPSELSGGMRKRVGLARGLVLDPKIVLYDEPTTGLDPLTTDDVDEMILEAREQFQVTSVVISHDIASAFKVATKLAVLYDGKIVAEGDQEALRAHPHPHVQAFLGMWFSKN